MQVVRETLLGLERHALRNSKLLVVGFMLLLISGFGPGASEGYSMRGRALDRHPEIN